MGSAGRLVVWAGCGRCVGEGGGDGGSDGGSEGVSEGACDGGCDGGSEGPIEVSQPSARPPGQLFNGCVLLHNYTTTT